MTRQQRLDREIRRKHPDECSHCGEPVEYVSDEYGTWAECACDAGYVS